MLYIIPEYQNIPFCFLKVIFYITDITIERCIEPLFNNGLLLSKEMVKAIMLNSLYPKVRDLIRDLVNSEKYCLTPYRSTPPK